MSRIGAFGHAARGPISRRGALRDRKQGVALCTDLSGVDAISHASLQWDIKQQIGLEVSKSRVIPPKIHSLSRVWPYAPVTRRSASSF
jgi:hypothetical protein